MLIPLQVSTLAKQIASLVTFPHLPWRSAFLWTSWRGCPCKRLNYFSNANDYYLCTGSTDHRVQELAARTDIYNMAGIGYIALRLFAQAGNVCRRVRR